MDHPSCTGSSFHTCCATGRMADVDPSTWRPHKHSRHECHFDDASARGPSWADGHARRHSAHRDGCSLAGTDASELHASSSQDRTADRIGRKRDAAAESPVTGARRSRRSHGHCLGKGMAALAASTGMLWHGHGASARGCMARMACAGARAIRSVALGRRWRRTCASRRRRGEQPRLASAGD